MLLPQQRTCLWMLMWHNSAPSFCMHAAGQWVAVTTPHQTQRRSKTGVWPCNQGLFPGVVLTGVPQPGTLPTCRSPTSHKLMYQSRDRPHCWPTEKGRKRKCLRSVNKRSKSALPPWNKTWIDESISRI